VSADQISKKKKTIFIVCTGLAVFLAMVVLGELFIAIVSPQRTMYPRREYSAEYGFTNYKNTKTVHQKLGRWRFVYTTNQYRNRGVPVLISNRYEKPNMLVLGDSYSFGVGVNDGEEYPAVMSDILRGTYNVTNLAVGGWGLTQHIRRYYEFGQLYSPKLVVLQFCINDLSDDFNNQVTIIEDNRFKFVDSNSSINWIKKYLSDSLIQKSQIYNLFRDSIYLYFARKHIEAASRRAARDAKSDKIPVREQFYNDLLDLFARDLAQKGVRLIMIAVNGQLDKAPNVKSKVFELQAEGLLEYVEVVDLLAGVENYGSPEGHLWGKKAHRILGEKLSEIVLNGGDGHRDRGASSALSGH
jgi:hypothetical protein